MATLVPSPHFPSESNEQLRLMTVGRIIKVSGKTKLRPQRKYTGK